MIELESLPTNEWYRGFCASRDKQPKEEIIAEAEKHGGEVVWIETLKMAFVKVEEK
jgi:hypothetical protein